jgi:DNA polymerase III alpha subunit (gram-positive type)
MSPQATIVSLVLMAFFVAVFRFHGGERYSCPYCGTKTGEHDTSCVWRSGD